MCLAVYLSSDKPLPTMAWDERAPAAYLEQVAPGAEVLRQFRYRHVYYVGSHEGCGCGFSKDGRDDEELRTCQANYESLGEVIASAGHTGARMQLFTCWEGEQSLHPTSVSHLRVSQLIDPDFELEQLHLLEVEV